MKVTIPVTFEVESLEDDPILEDQARSAAENAAFHYLAFCTVTDVNPGRDEVDVHVDGHGWCTVRMTEEG